MDDSLSDISDKISSGEEKKEVHKNMNKKVVINKNSAKKTVYRSKSVMRDDRDNHKEYNINNIDKNKRYNNNEQEEQKNNNKKPNFLLKNGNLNKIFLKNKDYLLKSLNILKNSHNKLNQVNSNNLNEEEYKKKENKQRKMVRSNSCINLRPKKKRKLCVTCLKFASNVSRDNDGLILFENKLGANNCFLNAIIQVLYHLKEFREKLMKIKIKKEINDPIFQVYTIFHSYESLSKLNTIETLNTALLRKALHHVFNTYPKGKFADPIETILEILELIHQEYFDQEEKSKQSNIFCKDEECPSHSNFLLYLKEIKFCSSCQALSVQKYDKDCFMFTISSSELFPLIDEEPFSKYKYSLFKKAKHLSQQFGQNDKVRLDKCQCKSISTRKRLFLYKKISPYLIINLTWDTDFPKLTDIYKIYGLIPLKDFNKNIFDLDLEKGKRKEKELSKDYYLSSMILFGQRHYTCFFYNQEIKMWSFVDDDKKKNFKLYNELIMHLITRRSFPVGIIFTSVNIFENEPKEKYSLNEDLYDEIYNNCLLEEQIEKEENEKMNKIINEKINENKSKGTKEGQTNEERTNNKKSKKDNDEDSEISY
jgi:hypothetical protein